MQNTPPREPENDSTLAAKGVAKATAAWTGVWLIGIPIAKKFFGKFSDKTIISLYKDVTTSSDFWLNGSLLAGLGASTEIISGRIKSALQYDKTTAEELKEAKQKIHALETASAQNTMAHSAVKLTPNHTDRLIAQTSHASKHERSI